MAKTINQSRFYIKPSPSNLCLILLSVHLPSGERMRFSTGCKVNSSQWDTTKQRAFKRTSKNGISILDGSNNDATNNRLDALKTFVDSLMSDCIRTGKDITSSFLKAEIESNLYQSKLETKPTVISFYESFLEARSTGQSLKTDSSRFSNSHIKQHKTTLNHLKAFFGKKKVYFDDINSDFKIGFLSYLTNKCGFSKNTIATRIKNLNVLLRSANKQEISTSRIFDDIDFKGKVEDINNIYLNKDELEILSGLPLKVDSKLDRVRDWFLMGCYTGLRFSDYGQIRDSNIRNGFLYIEQLKTQGEVIIPIMPELEKILFKYDFNPPLPISNQKLNKYLKELGAAAGIQDDLTVNRTKGGKRQSNVFQKFELITTHTARRSFATNAYLAGMNTMDIMKLTGHTSESSFMKYIKITKQEVATRVKEHSFFKGGMNSSSNLKIA